MGEVDEAVLGGEFVRPAFHCRAFNLHGFAAVPADQVVVVRGGTAGPVDGFTFVRHQDIHFTRIGECLQGAVDSGQADLGAVSPQRRVEVLSAAKAVALVQGLADSLTT